MGRRFLLEATVIGGAADPVLLLRTMRPYAPAAVAFAIKRLWRLGPKHGRRLPRLVRRADLGRADRVADTN